MKGYDIIISPVVTEKAIDELETQNKLTFEVRDATTKKDIAAAVSELYGVKVISVNTHKPMGKTKKAIVRLSPDTPASDIAAKMGII